jgi:hypothetical protein
MEFCIQNLRTYQNGIYNRPANLTQTANLRFKTKLKNRICRFVMMVNYLTITILDNIRRSVFYKKEVLETGLCLYLQVEPTGSKSLCLRKGFPE